MKRFLPVLCAAVLFGCSLDYGEELAENMDNTPNSILQGFELTSVKENRVTFRLKADVIESNNSRREDRVSGVSVEEFDAAGELRTSGSAASGVISQGSRDANLRDAEMYSRENEARIKATALNWTDNLRQLKSGPQDTVRIERGDGTIIEGSGLFADFNNAVLRFDGEVSGSYDEDADVDENRVP